MALHANNVSTPLNRLLASLPAHEYDQFKACLVRVSLVRDQVLVEHGQPVEHAYFIEHGVVSVVSDAADGEGGIQVAMIGREGMVGDVSPVNARNAACANIVVHMPGVAFRLTTQDLRRAIERSPALHLACTRFAQSLLVQVMQTAVCNARRSLTERCARWLVMTHDRVEGNEVQVTHEALSAMLGMHRPGVTVAAAALQQAGLIRTGRGRFTVLDRAGLQDVAQGMRPALRFTPSRVRPGGVRHGLRPPAAGAVF